MNKSRSLDQFYTKPEIAKLCYSFLTKYIKENSFFIEPSAGNGSFYSILPKDSRIWIDLVPQYEDVLFCDFFDFKFDNNLKLKYKQIITIGNPPFGKNSSLAIKFLNKSELFSNLVAFILPKTFKKDSVINKINPYLHLLSELELPKNSFIFNGEPYDVPCVFQIWEKTTRIRRL